MIGTNSKGKSDIDGLLILPVVVQNVDQVEKVKPLFHHINFLGNPTYEVSVWFVATSRRKRRFLSRSRQGVITFQAAKMIDPYLYCGPSDIFKLSGNALRNAVAGYPTTVPGLTTDTPFGGIRRLTSRRLARDTWSSTLFLILPRFKSLTSCAQGIATSYSSTSCICLCLLQRNIRADTQMISPSKLKFLQYAAYESYGATTRV